MLQGAKLSLLGPVAAPEENCGPGMTRRTILEDILGSLGKSPTGELGRQPHGPEPARMPRVDVDVSLSLIHKGEGGNSPKPSPHPAPNAGAPPALHGSINAKGPSADVMVDLTVPGVGGTGDPGGSPSLLCPLGPLRCPHNMNSDCSSPPTPRTPLDWLGSITTGRAVDYKLMENADKNFFVSPGSTLNRKFAGWKKRERKRKQGYGKRTRARLEG
ncbi:hypothetical protein BTVI_28742 [Pitangus sulphuratus]|nr:hypothetical protein BTVI_28742 [Pitangus sulphuratus]